MKSQMITIEWYGSAACDSSCSLYADEKDVFKFKVIFYPNEQLLDIRMRWVVLSQVQAPLASCHKPLASQSQVIIADKKQ